MRILAVSDEVSPYFFDQYRPGNLDGFDLILSCGDLHPEYLEFLVTMAHCPLLYVHGNHDEGNRREPEGCVCIDDTVYVHKGVRILGLGGCIRYRPDAVNMYTEREMEERIRSLRFSLRSTGGFDILLAHSPIRGVGDQDNMSHRGFECFGPLLDKYHPAVMIHGHVHQSYSAFFQRQREYHGIPVINASTSYVFDLPDTPDRREPSRRGIRLMEKASRFD